MRLYIDANAIIYSIEGLPQFREAAIRWIEQGQADAPLVTSQLSRLECRVKPLRERNDDLLSLFDAFFSSSTLLVRAIGGEIVDRATQIRALHGFKTPDAIHLATAVSERCDTFLTGDAYLTRFPDVRVVVLNPSERPLEK